MHRKIKIAFVSCLLDIGGIETLILELCKRLMSSQRYLPLVCTFQKNGKLQTEFDSAGVPIFVIEKGYGTDWRLPLKLARIFRREKVNIIHTHNESQWLYGGIAAKLCQLPIVHTEHTAPDYHEKRWKMIERFLAMMTPQITTVSKGVAYFMTEHERIPSRKIKVIYNGVEVEKYTVSIDVKKQKKELNIRENELIVGNVSRLVPIKDHITLLYAFKDVSRRIPMAKLLIAGDGPLRDELLALRGKLGLHEKVNFLGFQRNIPALLKVFDVFAFSSIPSIKEGLSISVLEAMASGLPVVSTGVDGTAEAVINGKTGFVVPPKDATRMAEAICKLLLDREEAKSMGERGEERVKRYFNFEKMIKEYENIYDAIAKKSC